MSSLKPKLEAANAALFTDRRLDLIPEYFSSEYIAHITGDNIAGGHDVIRKRIQGLLQAFPKLNYRLEVLIEHGDRIAWQRTFSGSQQAAFQGFPACGKEVFWRDMVISRFHNGLIAEEWFVSDLAEQLLRIRKNNKA